MKSGLPNVAGWGTAVTDFNALRFLVERILGRTAFPTLVLVKAVTNSGGVSPVGFVDVQIMLNQIDGNGKAVPHGTICNVPYFRIQGGASAVIMDPAVGDIGVAVFAGQDISSVKVNKAPSNPGSFRTFDLADAIYFGGVLNAVPAQYVQFSAAGITLVSPTAVTIQAPNIVSSGIWAHTGTFTADGTDLHTHVHIDAGGTGDSGPPA